MMMRKVLSMVGQKKYLCLAGLLFLLMCVAIGTPVKSHAAEKNFKVTIKYESLNVHESEKNKIRVYYWSPIDASSGRDGYEFKDEYVEFTQIAKNRGTYSKSAEISGPVQSVEVYVYGSATDSTQYYLEGIELTTLNYVEGSGKPKTVSLWEGMLGCSVGTVGSNTIYNKLFLNQDPNANGRPYPRYSGWLDPGTEWPALFGDDKKSSTNSYCKDACKVPSVEGIAGFKVTSAKDIDVPTDNSVYNYELNYDMGTPYDCFGAVWPDSAPTQNLKLSASNNYSIRTDNSGKKIIDVNPSCNAKEDYEFTITETLGAASAGDTINIHTFDYHYTMMGEDGSVLYETTVDYGDSVDLSDDKLSGIIWACDEYGDWRNTKNGPKDRVLHIKLSGEGGGTKEDPFRISTNDDWEWLRLLSEQDCTYGKYFSLEDDLSVTNGVGARYHDFRGFFDGNGHTITIDFNDKNYFYSMGIFTYIRGATIQNLITDGKFYCPHGPVGALVGESSGTSYIRNCIVYSTLPFQECSSGLVYKDNGSLTIENSAFLGTLKGYRSCGGFVGVGSNNTVLRNCIVYAKKGSGGESGSTFVDGSYKEISNCLYNMIIGREQGEPCKNLSLSEEEVREKATEYMNSVIDAQNTSTQVLKATKKAGGKATISWRIPKSVVKVKLEYTTDKNFKKNVKSKTVKIPVKKATLKKLKKGKVYYVRIKVYKSVFNSITGKKVIVEGAWSAVKKVKIG